MQYSVSMSGAVLMPAPVVAGLTSAAIPMAEVAVVCADVVDSEVGLADTTAAAVLVVVAQPLDKCAVLPARGLDDLPLAGTGISKTADAAGCLPRVSPRRVHGTSQARPEERRTPSRPMGTLI